VGFELEGCRVIGGGRGSGDSGGEESQGGKEELHGGGGLSYLRMVLKSGYVG